MTCSALRASSTTPRGAAAPEAPAGLLEREQQIGMGQLEAIDHLAVELGVANRLLRLQQRVSRARRGGRDRRRAAWEAASPPAEAARSSASRTSSWSASSCAAGDGTSSPSWWARSCESASATWCTSLGRSRSGASRAPRCAPGRVPAAPRAAPRRARPRSGLDVAAGPFLPLAASTAAWTRASSSAAASASATDPGSRPRRA